MATDVDTVQTFEPFQQIPSNQEIAEEDAFLSSEQHDKVLKEALCSVQPIPPDGRLGYSKLSLASRGLRQLLLLCDFGKLLSLDISDNKLSSLYPVRLAANLVFLNASRNKLTSSAELSTNHKLEQVDLSHNTIECLGDWQFNKRLRVLRLQGNRLKSLENANLSNNSLLRELDISCNAIESLELLPKLKCLDTLRVGHNLLKNLKGIERSPRLVIIHAEANQLESIGALAVGQRTSLLREIFLHENSGLRRPHLLHPLKTTEALQNLRLSPGPMNLIPHWRLHVVHKLPQLLQLDGVPVTAEEQLAAREAFGGLVSVHRKVWESLIPGEPFADRRLLKLKDPAEENAK